MESSKKPDRPGRTRRRVLTPKDLNKSPAESGAAPSGDQPNPNPAQASSSQKPTRESRQEPRIACNKTIDILPCAIPKGSWKFLTVEMIDCSQNGVGLYTDRTMSAGEQFLVKFQINSSISMLLYTVRDCTPLGDRRFRIGAEFTKLAASPLGDDAPTLLELLKSGK